MLSKPLQKETFVFGPSSRNPNKNKLLCWSTFARPKKTEAFVFGPRSRNLSKNKKNVCFGKSIKVDEAKKKLETSVDTNTTKASIKHNK